MLISVPAFKRKAFAIYFPTLSLVESLSLCSLCPEKQLKNKFMKKLPRDAEASNVLVGEVDFLENPFVAFVRLQQAVMLGALTEVPVPTR